MSIDKKQLFVKKIFQDKNLRDKYKKFLTESWSFTWPMLLIMFFDFCMNMTDVIIAGMIGKQTQAAVGFANQVYYILQVVVYAVTIGTIAVLSRIYGGADRARDLPKAVATALTLAVACASVMTVLGFIFGPLVLSSLDGDAVVKQKAIKFISVYCIGIFFHLMVIHFNGILRACGMMRRSMIILFFTAILNIVLNVIFCFHTPIGEAGIPLATAVCWVAAFIATSPLIFKLMKGEKTFSKEIAKKIFKISWPSGIIAFSWQLSSMVIYTIVAKLPMHSVEVMAALTAGLRIESMIYMPAFAFNMANAVLIGNLLGEKKNDDAFSIGLVTATVGVTLIIILTVLVISKANPIANLLASKDSSGTVDPQVLKEIITYLHIVILSEPFMACNLIISGALGGAGDTRNLMKYSLFSLWIIRIPMAYIFALKLGFGAPAIWWAMNITFLSQSFLSMRRYLSKKWMDDF